MCLESQRQTQTSCHTMAMDLNWTFLPNGTQAKRLSTLVRFLGMRTILIPTAMSLSLSLTLTRNPSPTTVHLSSSSLRYSLVPNLFLFFNGKLAEKFHIAKFIVQRYLRTRFLTRCNYFLLQLCLNIFYFAYSWRYIEPGSLIKFYVPFAINFTMGYFF